MENVILPEVQSYICNIGIAALGDRVQTKCQRSVLRSRLEDFISQKSKYHFSCSIEEEFDFGAIAEYLSGDLVKDVRMRLTGTSEERDRARKIIREKVRTYAKAQTKLGEKKALELTEDAIEIIHSYEKKQLKKDLQFIVAEISEEIRNVSDTQHSVQTKQIIKEIEKQQAAGVQEIVKHLTLSNDQVISEGIRLVNTGNTAALEKNITDFTNAISSQHTLFPYYGYDVVLRNGKQQLKSIPLSIDAEKLYPPQFKCTGTVRLGDQNYDRLTPELVDYANRHQLTIVLNIDDAQKLLGSEIDPVQHEADELIGQTLKIPPKPFHKAIPCSISINGTVAYDYVLFRTKQILDDGSHIVSNEEQKNAAYLITMCANLATKQINFSISPNNPSSTDRLQYLHFMKQIESGGIIAIKILELQTDLARGSLNDFHYHTGFSSLDEEINFWEMVITIENHFGRSLNIPDEISDDQLDRLHYLSSLVDGEVNTGEWPELEFRLDLTNNTKSVIDEWDGTPVNFSYVGTVTVPLWGEEYELPIIREYLGAIPQNMDRLKKKAEALEIGEEICLKLKPANGSTGIWNDRIRKNNDEDVVLETE